MINIDMWYGDKHTESDKIDVSFYPNDGEYRGNIYKNGKLLAIILVMILWNWKTLFHN